MTLRHEIEDVEDDRAEFGHLMDEPRVLTPRLVRGLALGRLGFDPPARAMELLDERAHPHADERKDDK
jgi:hypothetical protein